MRTYDNPVIGGFHPDPSVCRVGEDYYLVCLKEALDEPPVRLLREVLARPQWLDALAGIPGYTPSRSGEVLSLKQQLPWWEFRRPR